MNIFEDKKRLCGEPPNEKIKLLTNPLMYICACVNVIVLPTYAQ